MMTHKCSPLASAKVCLIVSLGECLVLEGSDLL